MLPVGVLPVGMSGVTPAIKNSLRFPASRSPYMTWTPGGSGTLGLWGFDIVLKRGTLGSAQYLYCSGTTNQRGNIYFNGSDQFGVTVFNSTGANAYWNSTMVFRDPNAHYDICVRAFSSASGNSYGGIELALYVNGVQQTFTLSTVGSPTGGDRINDSQIKHIGKIYPDNSNYFDGVMSRFIFTDGSAPMPSIYGANDANYGNEWKPKSKDSVIAGIGAFGTNGRFYDFADTTSTTTLGYDVSGRGNHATLSGFSLTAGVTYDALIDSPGNGATGTQPVGNYATINNLSNTVKSAVANTISNANLQQTHSGTNGWGNCESTLSMSSGSYYAEFTCTGQAGSGNGGVGIIAANTAYTSDAPSNGGYAYLDGGQYQHNGVNSQTVSGYTTNDVVMVAYDATNGKLWFGKNGAWLGTGSPNPATATSPAYSGLAGTFVFVATAYNGAGAYDDFAHNYGQRPFAYTPPTGFKALCTANLTSTTVTTSGTFTGNTSTDGPVVWLNGAPVSMTINGNAVTFGTHADKLATGFKLRSSSASYNNSGSNTYSITSAGQPAKYANAQSNP